MRVTRNATGTVKRLNAAVVVNHRSTTDAKGKTTTVALNPEELEKLTTLVRESIGFTKERGDSVKVINAPFKVTPVVTTEGVWWKQPEVIDLVRAAAVPTALAVVALLVLLGLVRPALKAAQSAPPGGRLNAVVGDAERLPQPGGNALPALEAPKSAEQLAQARQMAQDNPVAVANIVSGWVSGDA